MMKKLLIILILLLCLESNAQQTIATPKENEWETYLLSRIDSIQQKLYKLAIEFKIKSYKNDSMTSVYSRQELVQRGGKDTYIFVQVDPEDPEFGYDSIITTPFNPKDLKGLCFISQNLSSPFETDEKTNLTAIGILFQPIIGGMTFNKMPIALFDPKDIQNLLSPQDFEFIKLYYYFCKHGGGNFKYYNNYDEIHDNNFHELLFSKTQYFIGDSLQNKLIYSMLHSLDFFREALVFDTSKILFDEQENIKSSKIDINSNYFVSKVVFVVTDPDNPEKGIDTILKYPVSFNVPTHLTFTKEKSLEKVKFTFNKEEIYSVKSKKTKDEYTFTITKNDLIESGFQPIMLWFYEDYYRWLKESKR